MDGLVEIVTAVTAVACGLVAGVFFAFSTFVMDGLARAPETAGMVAMQWINRRAVTPAFMTLLTVPALASAGLAVWALVSLGEPGAPAVLAGSVLYLAGAILVTGAANIPLNDRLDAADAATSGALWRTYAARWTAWNHVRTGSCAVATALLVVAVT